jgi:hypothetical protein
MSGTTYGPYDGDAVEIDPFSRAVHKWVAKAGARADQAYLAIVLDMVARVKELTPVKTGYLRSNWTAVRAGDAQPVAGRVSSAEESLQDLTIADNVVIVNPVVYARRVEYGFVGTDSLGRHFNQRGAGMLARTVAELPSIAEAAVNRVIADQSPVAA